MKEVKFEQDSSEGSDWLSWRESGIGASEMSVIAGALPFVFNDVLELWKKKTKLVEDTFVMNEAMQLGKDTEPEARAQYIKATGIKVVATCYEHTLPFIKASLDGINKAKKHIVEIKVQGAKKFADAKKGSMTPYYYPQIQAQMLCSGAKTAHFWTYRPDSGGVLFEVSRNDEYIAELVRRATIFWECVEKRTPCLPRMLNINMRKEFDPITVGDMEVKLLGHFKN